MKRADNVVRITLVVSDTNRLPFYRHQRTKFGETDLFRRKNAFISGKIEEKII